MFSFYVLSVLLFRPHGVQLYSLLYANLGDNVTLPCFYPSRANHLSWYKQIPGEQPRVMSTYYNSALNSNFHNGFENNQRLAVSTGVGFYHLKISDIQDSDSAMYYCAQTVITQTQFINGTFVVLKESSIKSFLHQPVSESTHPGGSITLNCTVHNGTSDGDRAVYWFREHAGNSHLGILYTHRHSRSQCTESLNSSPRTCVYTLAKRNVTASDAGMYYCAVASCGLIVFGPGTKLDVTGKQSSHASSVLMHCLIAALLVSLIINVIFTCIFCKISRKKYPCTQGLQPTPRTPECTTGNQDVDSDTLQYAALEFKSKSKIKRARRTEKESLYSGVRLSNQE